MISCVTTCQHAPPRLVLRFLTGFLARHLETSAKDQITPVLEVRTSAGWIWLLVKLDSVLGLENHSYALWGFKF